MCVPFTESWPKAINQKQFIKRSLDDEGFDRKTFPASCSKVVFQHIFLENVQVYSIWVPQGIKSVPCPYPGDRICRHNRLIVSAPKSPMPTRIYLGTSPGPARINLISSLGGPCKDIPKSNSPHAPSLNKIKG